METESVDDEIPRFSLGEMALSEEEGRPILPGPASERKGIGRLSDTSTGDISSTGAVGGMDTGSSGIVARIRMAVVSEESSPEILQFEHEAIVELQQLIRAQTEILDENEDIGACLETHLQRLEIDRLNYLLRCYFRERIKKIERLIFFVLKDEITFDRLSPHEQKFAASYMDLVENHFNKSFLSMLPERLRVLDKDGNVDHVTRPNLDTFVFCRVLRTVGQYVVSEDPNDEPFDLVKDDIICIRYGSVQKLLLAHDVELL